MKKIFLRALMAITMCLVMMFLSCNFETSNLSSAFGLVGLILVCVCGLYFSLRNYTESKIYELLGITWLSNKTGIDFTSEE